MAATTAETRQPDPRAATPLCVELDRALCRTDTRHEAALQALAQRGRTLKPDSLPYNEALVAYLVAQHASGRRLVLVTSAPVELAEAVARRLGLFDEVLASPGLRPAERAVALCDRFGAGGFDYIGEEAAIRRQARAGAGGYAEAPRRVRWSALLRVHQWSKNLIVVVPLLAAHEGLAGPAALRTLVAVAAFCLCASGTYIVNDLLDLAADRKSAHKRRAPLAAGDLPLRTGMLLAPGLVLAGLGLAALVSAGTLAAAGAYVALTLAYSLYLKRRVLVDVFALAALYTIRLVAGHEAGQIRYSAWLLSFSMFLFLSLALVKRVAELQRLRLAQTEKTLGRNYVTLDLELLQGLGLVSGGLAVLILALYVTGAEVTLLYRQPLLLLALCPILFYWIARLWLITHRGNMHGDPVLFALKDRISYYLLAVVAAVVVAATLL